MQKILITGANGFVGYYLTNLLVKKEYQIIATGKGENRLPFNQKNFCYYSLDFTDAAAVEKIFTEHQPQIVIHCGALSKPDECELNKEAAFKTNVTGTLTLLKKAEKCKSFFVFLSTDFVFDGVKGMYAEEDERSAVNYYGETKLLAENEVMKYSLDWTIVRTVLVYGKPFLSRQNILTTVAAALQKGEQLNIFNDQVRTPTFVEDLAIALVTIIEKTAKGIYHISGIDVLTPYQMAIAVADYLNLDSSLIKKVAQIDFDQPAKRPLKTGFDISKAQNRLGYNPVSFKEGLSKTFST